MLTHANYFPNGQIHAWTHGGVYYVVTDRGEIYGSYNKFKYDSFLIGEIPGLLASFNVRGAPNPVDLINFNEGTQELRSLFVQGSWIFAETEDYINFEGTKQKRYYVSNSYGSTWRKLDSVTETFAGYSDYKTTDQWGKGAFAFMTVDSQSCYAYFYKPLLEEGDDGSLKIKDWYIHRSDDTVVHNPLISSKNTVTLEDRFRSNGSVKGSFSNRLNNMDSHDEEFRKPYILRWPTLINTENDPETIDRSGYVANGFDTITYTDGVKSYAVVRVLQELTIRSGLIANNENNYLPDYLTTRVPIFYVVDVDAIGRGSAESKASIRVLDLVGFDNYLMPLHTAHFTVRQGVYSFISSLLGKDFSFEQTYGAPGTIYDYAPGSEEFFPERPVFTKLIELACGDLMKITDPENQKDVAAFLTRNRVKVCVGDPSKEYNWIDKSTETTYIRPFQKVQLDESIVILTEDTENKVRPVLNSWCTFDTVLRYDYENSKLLGYPVYDNDAPERDRQLNLIGYTFPSFSKTGGGNYTVGTVRNQSTAVLTIPATVAQYTEAMDDEPTNSGMNRYYGGFVAAERGYVGSLQRFVTGIEVPPEPEFPPAPVDPEPELPGSPLPAPTVLAVLDDVKKSPSADISPNRREVSFGGYQGSAVSNIGVSEDKWYLEISNIGSRDIYFGLANITFDVNKEPGEGSDVLAVSMYHDVIRGGRLIYKGNNNLITTVPSNAVIGIKIDMVNRLLHFTNGSGVWQTTAILGMPSGIVYFYVGAEPTQNGPSAVSVNFGQSAFAYTVPNGYIRGFGIK